jgi:hypothetical protein
MIRTGFTNALLGRELGPQGLKPAFLLGSSGTAEAVPFPKPFFETSFLWELMTFTICIRLTVQT